MWRIPLGTSRANRPLRFLSVPASPAILHHCTGDPRGRHVPRDVAVLETGWPGRMGRKGSPEKPVENSWHKSWKRDPQTGSPVPQEWSSWPDPAFIQTEYSLSPLPNPLYRRRMPGNLAGHLFTGAGDGWAAHPATPLSVSLPGCPGAAGEFAGSWGWQVGLQRYLRASRQSQQSSVQRSDSRPTPTPASQLWALAGQGRHPLI